MEESTAFDQQIVFFFSSRFIDVNKLDCINPSLICTYVFYED